MATCMRLSDIHIRISLFLGFIATQDAQINLAWKRWIRLRECSMYDVRSLEYVAIASCTYLRNSPYSL